MSAVDPYQNQNEKTAGANGAFAFDEYRVVLA
jgi:hypothetical protein